LIQGLAYTKVTVTLHSFVFNFNVFGEHISVRQHSHRKCAPACRWLWACRPISMFRCNNTASGFKVKVGVISWIWRRSVSTLQMKEVIRSSETLVPPMKLHEVLIQEAINLKYWHFPSDSCNMDTRFYTAVSCEWKRHVGHQAGGNGTVRGTALLVPEFATWQVFAV
jgi:hypothetical protein